MIQARLRRCAIGQIRAFLVWVRLGFGCSAHVENLQVFKDQRTKAIHQSTHRFVVEVLALIAHLAMGFCQGKSSAFPPLRITLAPVLDLREQLDALQPPPIVARVLDGFTSGEGGKMEQAQIDAYGLI